MARRSDHSPEELKQIAIDAGIALIREHGLSGFSIRKVASDIGYTVGTLSYIFGDYDHFLLHINAATLDEWHQVMQSSIAQSQKSRQSPKKQLETLAMAYISYSRSHYHQWCTLFEHHMGEGQPLPDWYEPKIQRMFDMAESIILPLVGNNPTKARTHTHTVWSAIHGICVLSLTQKLELVGTQSAESLAKQFITTYLTGLLDG